MGSQGASHPKTVISGPAVETTPAAATAALGDLHARARETAPRPASGDELDLRALGAGVNQVVLDA
jgi:hypothetical protein